MKFLFDIFAQNSKNSHLEQARIRKAFSDYASYPPAAAWGGGGGRIRNVVRNAKTYHNWVLKDQFILHFGNKRKRQEETKSFVKRN